MKYDLVKKYNRAIENFWRKARSMAERGYTIDTVVPNRPKRITEASVRRIKKLSEQLYNKSWYTLPSGDVVSGTQGRKYERSQSAKKAARTRSIRKAVRQEEPWNTDWRLALQWVEGIVTDIEGRGYLQVGKAIRDIIDSATVRTSEKQVGVSIANARQEVQEDIESMADYFYSAQAEKFSYAAAQLSMLLGGGTVSASQMEEYSAADEDGEYEYR